MHIQIVIFERIRDILLLRAYFLNSSQQIVEFPQSSIVFPFVYTPNMTPHNRRLFTPSQLEDFIALHYSTNT